MTLLERILQSVASRYSPIFGLRENVKVAVSVLFSIPLQPSTISPISLELSSKEADRLNTDEYIALSDG